MVGSRKADLLRVTDWFFAQGLDHHHLMAGVPGLSDVMQERGQQGRRASAALPPEPVMPVRPARRLEADVVVVGGGVAGVAAAPHLRGRRAPHAAPRRRRGWSSAAPSPAGAPAEGRAAISRRCPLAGVEVLTRTAAAGDYEGELLVAVSGDEGAAVLVRTRAR